MAEKKKKVEDDNLSEIIAAGLNKDGHDAFFLGSDDTSTDLTDFISTGSSILDVAVSNRPHGGIACGRITEFTGLEGSGKSLVSAHIMANCQKEGGVAVLIDTETAVNEDFFRAVGVQMDKKKPNPMLYIQPKSLETLYEAVEKIIEVVRKSDNKDRKAVIIVDSIGAVATKRELEGDYDKAGFATDRAIINGLAMKKLTDMVGKNKIALVFTNQLRHKMNVMAFADPWTTSGGKALGFHASTRIRFASGKKITVGEGDDKVVVGIEVEATVTKNRLGPPWRKVKFQVYFDRGIDDIGSWLDFLKKKNIIEGTNGRYTYIDSNGEEHKFQKSTWKEFAAANKFVVDELYQRMCDTMIMSYATEGISTDDGTANLEDAGDAE